jgi:hypothetical protein
MNDHGADFPDVHTLCVFPPKWPKELSFTIIAANDGFEPDSGM